MCDNQMMMMKRLYQFPRGGEVKLDDQGGLLK